jgi:hypothetical protein
MRLDPIKIAVINHSTVVNDVEVKKVVAALQKQVTRDFYPVWGVNARLRFLPRGAKPRANDWWLVILDDSNQAGNLGYHDLTPHGNPIGKVFAGSDKKYGYEWTVTASHELLEMLADPYGNLSILEETEHGKKLYAYEVCDPSKGDKFGYRIGGVLVANFVYPAWFENHRKPGSTRFDHRDHIRKPLKVVSSGYIPVYNILKKRKGWEHEHADRATDPTPPPAGTRRALRRIPLTQRLKSSIHLGRVKN